LILKVNKHFQFFIITENAKNFFLIKSKNKFFQIKITVSKNKDYFCSILVRLLNK